MPDITYRVRPEVTDEELNRLFSSAWANHLEQTFGPTLERSLAYICAYVGEQIVGFVNVAWDGGLHAFVLDTTVHADHQRRGIGSTLVKRAIDEADRAGVEWIHVDYEPHLEGFYLGCGFKATKAGLLNLPLG